MDSPRPRVGKLGTLTRTKYKGRYEPSNENRIDQEKIGNFRRLRFYDSINLVKLTIIESERNYLDGFIEDAKLCFEVL